MKFKIIKKLINVRILLYPNSTHYGAYPFHVFEMSKTIRSETTSSVVTAYRTDGLGNLNGRLAPPDATSENEISPSTGEGDRTSDLAHFNIRSDNWTTKTIIYL